MVSGFSGRNELANISRVPWLSPLADLGGGPAGGNVVGRAGSATFAGRTASPAGPAPNTTMRAALQRRAVGVPGDLGWQTTAEVTLSANANDFHVVWFGSLALPAGMQAGSYRILVTESETYLRTDIVPGDPNVSTSPLDFVRERVVYAE